MALDTVYRVTAQFNMPETTIMQWVWHYWQYTSGSSENQVLLDDIESNLSDAWDEIKAAIHDGVSGDTLELAVWDSVELVFNTILSNDISALVGTDTTYDMLPHQDAAVVKFFTGLGRSLGKKFVSGLVETTQADSILTGATITLLLAFANVFNNTIVSGGDSYAPGNFQPASGTVRSWTESVAVNALLGGQKRRRPGIGI